jgi:hypothetical protein
VAIVAIDLVFIPSSSCVGARRDNGRHARTLTEKPQVDVGIHPRSSKPILAGNAAACIAGV